MAGESALDLAIGEYIYRMRNAAGMSQKGMATKLGVTIGQYRRYEHGIIGVPAGHLIQIANISNMSLVPLIRNLNPVPYINGYDGVRARALLQAIIDATKQLGRELGK